MINFFKSFFKGKGTAKVDPSREQTTTSSTKGRDTTHLELQINESEISSLASNQEYAELERRLKTVPNKSLALDNDGDISLAIFSLSLTENNETALNLAKLLINKVDVAKASPDQTFEILWGVANSRNGENTIKVFQHLVESGFQVNAQRTLDESTVASEIMAQKATEGIRADLDERLLAIIKQHNQISSSKTFSMRSEANYTDFAVKEGQSPKTSPGEMGTLNEVQQLQRQNDGSRSS